MEKCITLLLNTTMCPRHSDRRSQALLLFSSLFPCLGTPLTAAEPFAGGERLTSGDYTDVSSLEERGIGGSSAVSTNIGGRCKREEPGSAQGFLVPGEDATDTNQHRDTVKSPPHGSPNPPGCGCPTKAGWDQRPSGPCHPTSGHSWYKFPLSQQTTCFTPALH